MTVVVSGIAHELLPRAYQGASSVLVGFVGFSHDPLRSELGSDSVDGDNRDVISFVSWIGLDRRISVGQSGFRRLDLMLRVAPTRIIRGFWSRLATVNQEVGSLEGCLGQA